MLRLPRCISAHITREADHSKHSGLLRAVNALAAAASAAADLLADCSVSDSGAKLSGDVLVAAVTSATALLAAAAALVDEDVQEAKERADAKRGGKSGSAGATSGEALRLTATGCDILAAVLPQLQPGSQKTAGAAAAKAVGALASALAWASRLRLVPKAIQRDILESGCKALAAAIASRPAGRGKTLAISGGADWGEQADALRRTLAAPVWQQLQGPAADLRAALTAAANAA